MELEAVIKQIPPLVTAPHMYVDVVNRVKVVTGYIDIPYHPRGPNDYRKLGKELLDGLKPYEAFVFDDERLSITDTWMARMFKGANLSHSVADNPEKNTLAYHFVQHEKFEFLQTAMDMDKENSADIYVWIDYGILHVPGVTVEIIKDFLGKAEDFGRVTMPGCWLKTNKINPAWPCWRFCGGVVAVPRGLMKSFIRNVMGVATRQISQTQNIEWEVNSLARLELLDTIPITWYEADHNETMFTNAP